jgi:hypothetical protein
MQRLYPVAIASSAATVVISTGHRGQVRCFSGATMMAERIAMMQSNTQELPST